MAFMGLMAFIATMGLIGFIILQKEVDNQKPSYYSAHVNILAYSKMFK